MNLCNSLAANSLEKAFCESCMSVTYRDCGAVNKHVHHYSVKLHVHTAKHTPMNRNKMAENDFGWIAKLVLVLPQLPAGMCVYVGRGELCINSTW